MKEIIENDRLWTLLHEPEGPLVPYLDSFAKLLDERGFKRHLISRQIRIVAYLSKWLLKKSITIDLLSEEHVSSFFEEYSLMRIVARGEKATVRRFMDFLLQLAVIRKSTTCEKLTPIQQAVMTYAHYLREERELSEKSIIKYSPVIERFLFEGFGDEPLVFASLCAQDVIGFIKREALRLSPAGAKSATTALRSFLSYLRYRGDIYSDLAAAVPKVPNWAMSGIPRAIAPEHIQAVLANCPRDTAIGKRDYAILMLLVHLGLRASEIVSLTLDSINWESGSVSIAGKGNKLGCLPLPTKVGEAIVDYLQDGRPASHDRALFLRDYAPIRGLGGEETIGTIVNMALTRAKIVTTHRGAHQFRHALAVKLLQQGATLNEIGSLLRHQHPKTTGIYAKVDFTSLRPLSLPWPGGVV
jgi:site-specific recombinase XerD